MNCLKKQIDLLSEVLHINQSQKSSSLSSSSNNNANNPTNPISNQKQDQNSPKGLNGPDDLPFGETEQKDNFVNNKASQTRHKRSTSTLKRISIKQRIKQESLNNLRDIDSMVKLITMPENPGNNPHNPWNSPSDIHLDYPADNLNNPLDSSDNPDNPIITGTIT